MAAAWSKPARAMPRFSSTTASPFRAGNLLKLARLLAARATLRAEEGNLDGALDDLRALFRSARALRQEPMLLSQVVRLSIDDVGLAVLEVVLPQCAAAVPALERVELDDPRGAVAQGNRGAAGAAVETLLTPGAIDPDASGLARDDPLYWTLRMRSVAGRRETLS